MALRGGGAGGGAYCDGHCFSFLAEVDGFYFLFAFFRRAFFVLFLLMRSVLMKILSYDWRGIRLSACYG